LYLNNYEEAFYQVYLIESKDRVTVPYQFIIPVTNDDDIELHKALFGSGSLNIVF
jgi:hypothetical protein